MARLTLLIFGLALYFAPNPVDCKIWGDIAEKLDLDSNLEVKLVNNNTKVVQEIPSIFTLSGQNQTANNANSNVANTDQKFTNITVKTTTAPKTEIPKFVGQPRIVPAAAPKAPVAGGVGAATTAKPAAGGAVGAATTAKPAAGGAVGPKTITYKLGQRVAGDHVIASAYLNQQWTTAQNVTQTLSYPKSGVGSVITYVEIIVDQGMNLGRAFVNTGGIGQRQISLTIESLKTLYYRQNTQIYGY